MSSPFASSCPFSSSAGSAAALANDLIVESFTIDDITRDGVSVLAQNPVWFVDDGSADGTAEVTQRVMETHPHVRLVQHPVNQGFGAAVFSGFTNAEKDWIFYTDADRQFVLSELERFKPHMDEADLIAGSDEDHVLLQRKRTPGKLDQGLAGAGVLVVRNLQQQFAGLQGLDQRAAGQAVTKQDQMIIRRIDFR